MQRESEILAAYKKNLTDEEIETIDLILKKNQDVVDLFIQTDLDNFDLLKDIFKNQEIFNLFTIQYNKAYFEKLKRLNIDTKEMFFKFVKEENVSDLVNIAELKMKLTKFKIGLNQLKYYIEKYEEYIDVSLANKQRQQEMLEAKRKIDLLDKTKLNQKLQIIQTSLDLLALLDQKSIVQTNVDAIIDASQNDFRIKDNDDDIEEQIQNNNISDRNTIDLPSIYNLKSKIDGEEQIGFLPTKENSTLFILLPQQVSSNSDNDKVTIYVQNDNQTPKYFKIDESEIKLTSVRTKTNDRKTALLIQMEKFSIINNSLIIVIVNNKNICKIQRLDIINDDLQVFEPQIDIDAKKKITKIKFDETKFDSVNLFYVLNDKSSLETDDYLDEQSSHVNIQSYFEPLSPINNDGSFWNAKSVEKLRQWYDIYIFYFKNNAILLHIFFYSGKECQNLD